MEKNKESVGKALREPEKLMVAIGCVLGNYFNKKSDASKSGRSNWNICILSLSHRARREVT